MNDYFEKILQAEVYEVAKKTPLEKAHNLSNSLNKISLGNFKLRTHLNRHDKISERIKIILWHKNSWSSSNITL